MESLEKVSPHTLSSVGLICLNNTDVTWPLIVERWLAARPEREREVLRMLCERYISPTLEFLACTTTVPPVADVLPTQSKPSALRHVVNITETSMITTLLTLVEVQYQNVTYLSLVLLWVE